MTMPYDPSQTGIGPVTPLEQWSETAVQVNDLWLTKVYQLETLLSRVLHLVGHPESTNQERVLLADIRRELGAD